MSRRKRPVSAMRRRAISSRAPVATSGAGGVRRAAEALLDRTLERRAAFASRRGVHRVDDGVGERIALEERVAEQRHPGIVAAEARAEQAPGDVGQR